MNCVLDVVHVVDERLSISAVGGTIMQHILIVAGCH